MRPKEFCKGSIKPELFLAGIEPADIRQGRIGDCYFLGAVATTAMHPRLIKNLFVPSAYNEYGIYQIRLFYNGKWQEIIVDDLIAMCVSSKIESKTRSNLAPLFARSVDVEELWVMLLEKAYAKLHNSYEAIEGAHSIREAFEHLTGGWSDAVELKPYAEGKEDPYLFFSSLVEWKKSRHLMATSTASDNDLDFEHGLMPNDDGIVPKHAYSILDVRLIPNEDDPDLPPHHLIKLRNTWGKTEWLGKYSDSWDGWTDTMKKKVNLVNRDDGAFWMCVEDYVKQFNYLYVCRVPIQEGFMKEISAIPKDFDPKKIKEEGSNQYIVFDKRGGACEWNQSQYQNAGGQQYFKETFLNNPQFRLTINAPPPNSKDDFMSDFSPNPNVEVKKDNSARTSSGFIRVIVSIRLVEDEKTREPNEKRTNTKKKPNPVGIYIFRNRQAQKTGKYALMEMPAESDLIGKCNMKKLTRDAVEVFIPRPSLKKYEKEKEEGLHDYTIVACRWYPNTEGTFAVQVCSDYAQLQFEALGGTSSDFSKRVINGEWNGRDSCGAHWQVSTFATNPKFHLQCMPPKEKVDENEINNGFLKNPIHMYVESANGNIPFFPYIVPLAKFKKWTQQTIVQPLGEADCALFPPNGNEFFTIRHAFECELACKVDKPVSYLLIMATPYKIEGKFTIVLKSKYEITTEPLSN